VYCGRFQRAKKFDCIAQNTFHKTFAKHRKTPQHTAKQSQNAFCEIRSQKNTAKQTQNAQKSHKTVALQPQYVLRAFGVFFKNTLDLSQKYTMRNTRKLRITGGVTYPRRGSRLLKKQCFVVICGVLRCFVCVFLAFFTKQTKTDQKKNSQNEQNTLCAIQRNTVLCIFLSLRKCLQKTFAKHVQNIAKHPQNTAKHRKTLFFEKHSQNTRKTPAKHRKTSQNTTKQIC